MTITILTIVFLLVIAYFIVKKRKPVVTTTTTNSVPVPTTTTTTTIEECRQFCFKGIYSENDAIHPNGGTVVYIDCLGQKQSEIGIFGADEVSIYATSIISHVGCSPQICNTIANVVDTKYYGYVVNVYVCGVCDNIPTQSRIIVQDTHSDLLLNRYYVDSITGYVFKIMDTVQLVGGQKSNMVGEGVTSCKYVKCL